MHDDTRPTRPHPLVSRRAVIQASAGAALLSATGIAVARQSTPPAGEPAGPVLPLYPHGAAITLDPHRAINWGPHWVILPYVWAGLVGFDAQGAVVPVLASAVEPEEEGAVWVAAIRPEAAFASGNPVTAQALIAGWKRALRPQRPAPMAEYMRRVEGYDAFVTGESEEIGFEARDERTIAIRLTEPYALFPEDLATFVWAAVDIAALDDVPESRTAFSGASAGRWRFVEASGDGTIRMSLRDDASGDPSGFTEVTFRPFDGPLAAETAIEALAADDIAVADAPAPVRARLDGTDLADSLQVVESSGSTMLLGMDFSRPPFDDPRVRRAVAHAIDRERWATEIMGSAFTPAQSISPPAIAANANYAPPEPLPFDPDAARQLLQDAGITGNEMPTVVYHQRADAPEPEVEEAAALLAMIEEHSGLRIEHDRSLTADQIDALRRDQQGLQFDLRWWWPLTNSPSGLAHLGTPDSPEMDGWFNWSTDLENDEAAGAAAAFQTAIDEALTSLDQTERTQRFAEAESLLVDTAVYVPLGHGVQAYVTSGALQGTRHGAFSGYLPIDLDEQVSWTPPEGSGTPT